MWFLIYKGESMSAKDKRSIEQQVYDDYVVPFLGKDTVLVSVKKKGEETHTSVFTDAPLNKALDILVDATGLLRHGIYISDKESKNKKG
jgi:hypothetical protein